MCEKSTSGLQHSVSVPLLQDNTLELKDFTVGTAAGPSTIEREGNLHRFSDAVHTPRTVKRLAGLFGKSPRELHSEYANISLHQARKYIKLNYSDIYKPLHNAYTNT